MQAGEPKIITFSKKVIPICVAVGCLALVLSAPSTRAYQQSLVDNYVAINFDDSGPVTTPIDIRLSLWRLGDPEPGDREEDGDIVTSSINYGGWQYVIRSTPDSQGGITFNLFDTTDFPTLPEIQDDNAYLQIEYKYPAEQNSAYRTVDMLQDDPNFVTRHLLVQSLLSLDPQLIKGGTPNNSFIIDINQNSPDFIKLIFGEAAKELAYDVISNWFNLNGRLNINGFTGIKFAINAHADDAETQLLSIRDSAGTPVFYVDEDGDVFTSGNVDGMDISAEVSRVWRGGLGGSSDYKKNVKNFVRTIAATPSSGIVTVYVTDDDTASGNIFFNTVFSINIMAEKDETTAGNIPFASLKNYDGDTGRLDINVLEGSASSGIEFETDPIKLDISIIGK
jgi:hypothetical protein